MSGILRPVELEIEGFRSFVDKSVIKFPDIKRGAILISGSYKDGSTSSGSGKSTVLMAMAFALGFCDVPTTELKSWYGKKKISVKFKISDDDNTYDIIRNPTLKLLVNGKEYEGTATGAKEELDKILKASPELVKALTYRPQREKGVFLSNTDSKNKEFLTKILDLDPVEAAGDVFSKEVSSLSSGIAILESSIESLDMQVQSSSVPEHQVQEAEESLNRANTRLNSIKNIDESSLKIKEELQNIEIELGKIYQVGLQVNSAKQQNMSIRQHVEIKQKEISALERGICHTCEREWNKSKDLIGVKKTEISQLIESMKSNLTLIKNSDVLLDKNYQTSLSVRKSELHGELGKLSAPLNDAMQSSQMARSNLDNLNRLKTEDCQV